MSGPVGEFGSLYTRTSVEASLWPLEIWADGGEAHVECGECGGGGLLVARMRGKTFLLAELTARVEEHITRCPGARSRS